MDIPRRNFLLLLASALVQSESHAQHDPQHDMIVRSARPEDLEMPLSGFSDYITPIDRFFVRTHVPVPKVELNEWRLKVEGEVGTPLILTMADVKQLPAIELLCVAECAGNGRGFYEPAVPGVQWEDGGVGNGRWRGVRLADVLKRAGLKDSAREILFDGADVPLGTMPDFQRSIPVKKALDPNTMLAYEMNGETLPVKHGFPLRVVTPGWAGDSWVKWLTSIRALDREHDGFWMKNAYRHPGMPVAPGTAVPPDQMQPVTSLRVKSVIASPLNGTHVVTGQPLVIRGVAWGGDAGPVAAVDVSVDGGRTWKPAALQPNQQTPFGWRQWSYAWTPQQAQYHTILARARDTAGNIQPVDQEWNPSGYAWNVVPRAHVSAVSGTESAGVAASAGGTSAAPPAPPPGFPTSCLVCHGDDVIRQQRLTRPQWEREMTKMLGWGAKVTAEDRLAFLDYLAGNFGPRPRGR